MDLLLQILQILSNFSPLGVIALLGVVIFMLVKAKQEVAGKVDVLADNHLHEVNDSLRRIETLLQDINTNVIWLRARANGKH